jgi:hypothetical protein
VKNSVFKIADFSFAICRKFCIVDTTQLSAANQRCRMRTGLNKIRHEFSGRSHNRVFQQYRPKVVIENNRQELDC